MLDEVAVKCRLHGVSLAMQSDAKRVWAPNLVVALKHSSLVHDFDLDVLRDLL